MGQFTVSAGGESAAVAYTVTANQPFTIRKTLPTPAISGIAGLGLTTADLTVVNGDLIIDNAYVAAHGVLYQNLLVKGFVVSTATSVPRVKLRGCKVQGRTFTPGSPPYQTLLYARASKAAFLDSEFCDLIPVQPDVNLSTGCGERLGSSYRNLISRGSDGLDYWATAAPDVQGCCFLSYSFWADDPKHLKDGTHPGWSHNDYIQNSGSTGGKVIGNAFHGFADPDVGDVAKLIAGGFTRREYGSAVMLTASGAPISGMVIQDNWVYGCEIGIQQPLQSFATGNSWDVSGNRFALDGRRKGPYGGQWQNQLVTVRDSLGTASTDIHDNVYMDDPSVPAALRGTKIPGPLHQTANPAQFLLAYSSPS